jgi:hypothetical protein
MVNFSRPTQYLTGNITVSPTGSSNITRSVLPIIFLLILYCHMTPERRIGSLLRNGSEAMRTKIEEWCLLWSVSRSFLYNGVQH